MRKKSVDAITVGTILCFILGFLLALGVARATVSLIDNTITLYQLNGSYSLTEGKVVAHSGGYRGKAVTYSFNAPAANGSNKVFLDTLWVNKDSVSKYRVGINLKVWYVPENPTRSALNVYSLPKLMSYVLTQLLALALAGGLAYFLLSIVRSDVRSSWQGYKARRSPSAG